LRLGRGLFPRWNLTFLLLFIYTVVTAFMQQKIDRIRGRIAEPETRHENTTNWPRIRICPALDAFD